ncbi:DUF6545 domain-containing protein [Nocardia caishijiensis]|uniref:DUF6545 domain-containing protein n=1 Tax=Nocardia caishijiensis TaxID=184756 RepID=A0ABQ6YTV2_9NOCA|nr:DUF6545 domain-containing protein [Nocardia caishijiensis]KAF0849189.1 hypothetical protein FNL39_101626 [Nocardia caishijiensis]
MQVAAAGIALLAGSIYLVRLRVCATTPLDNAFNLLLGMSALLVAALHPAVYPIGSTALPAVPMWIGVVLIGVTHATVSLTNLQIAWQSVVQQRSTGLVATVWGVTVVATMCCALVAGTHGDRWRGWWELGLWLSLAPLAMWGGSAVGRVCVVHLSRRPPVHEKVLYWALLGALVGRWGHLAVAVGTAWWRARRGDNDILRAVSTANTWVVYMLTLWTAGMLAVALAAVLLRRYGLDRWSRVHRRLRPLWSDLIESCPEIVLRSPTEGRLLDGRFRVHRTVIEIRDCVLLLSEFATPHPASTQAAIDGADDPAHLDVAIRLARARTARKAGSRPVGATMATLSPTADLADELRQLTRIAHVWPHACALVAREKTGRTTASASD